MKLITELKEALTDKYRNYETKINSIDGIEEFAIINPFWSENIVIHNTDGIIFCFSSHYHAHFDYGYDDNENITRLMKHIDDFLDGTLIIYECFHRDTPLFCGCKEREVVDVSSRESFMETLFGNIPILYEMYSRNIQNIDFRCSIRGWNNAHNKDIDFAL